MDRSSDTLVLTQADVAALLTMEDCIAVVERAFDAYGQGRAGAPGILGMHATHGGFHIKAGFLDVGRSYFAAKLNANFPENPSRFQMPTIQGTVVLCDADNGFPLAIMDSIEITSRRTAAATAIAARYLARPDAGVATVCGAGIQGRAQIQALAKVPDAHPRVRVRPGRRASAAARRDSQQRDPSRVRGCAESAGRASPERYVHHLHDRASFLRGERHGVAGHFRRGCRGRQS